MGEWKDNAVWPHPMPQKKQEVDWQQVRIQAAIAAMDIVKGAYNIHDDVEQLVQHAVRIADALIKELKGGEQ